VPTVFRNGLLSKPTAHPLSEKEVTPLPATMLASHLLLAYFVTNTERHEVIALEQQALDLLDRHFDAVDGAAMSG
jgi:hypothetical protein